MYNTCYKTLRPFESSWEIQPKHSPRPNLVPRVSPLQEERSWERDCPRPRLSLVFSNIFRSHLEFFFLVYFSLFYFSTFPKKNGSVGRWKTKLKYWDGMIILHRLTHIVFSFLLGLFSWERIFGGAVLLEGMFWFGLDNKNSLKHYENSPKQLKTANTNSPWACILGGLLSEGFLRLRFGRGGGGGAEGAYFREGLC